MAYVDQTKKAKIQAALKAVMPKSWKWSLAVRHHSTIVLTIASAPVDLIDVWMTAANNSFRHYKIEQKPSDVQINGDLKELFSGELLETFLKIQAALNTDNCHYVDLHLGKWDRPFVVK